MEKTENALEVTMTTASETVLSESIADARSTLRQTRIKGPHHFVLTALAGYLWTAIATSDTLLAVIRSGMGRGADPLKRVLHECYLDVLFMASDPDPDSLAARSFLSEYRDSRALLRDYRAVLAAHPGISLPPVPQAWTFFDQPVDEVIQELDRQNATQGGAHDLFARAWKWWKDPPYWHWSGLNRKKMVDVLIDRGRLDGKAAFVALSLTRIFNAAAHAGPPWSELPPTPDGSTDPPTLQAPDVDLDQLALAGDQFLRGLSKEMKDFFDLHAK